MLSNCMTRMLDEIDYGMLLVGSDAQVVYFNHAARLELDGQHPLQKAWEALDVPQCGFCQSGMLMAAAALLKNKPRPTEAEVRENITNICRCGTYNRVQAAIMMVSKA